MCGVGEVLKITNGTKYKLSLGHGTSTNTKGEILALWSLLYFANLKHISQLHVAGNSKLIIDWMQEHCRLQVINLE